MISMDGPTRQRSFEGLVLQGLWLLVLLACGSNPKTYCHNWRANALFYMDEVGTAGDEAKAYRREVGFPELRM
jgi:hypothetical protein